MSVKLWNITPPLPWPPADIMAKKVLGPEDGIVWLLEPSKPGSLIAQSDTVANIAGVAFAVWKPTPDQPAEARAMLGLANRDTRRRTFVYLNMADLRELRDTLSAMIAEQYEWHKKGVKTP